MPHYLLQGSYSAQGISGLISSPEDRSAMARELFERAGGRIESFYYSFGDYDFAVILELPDRVSMVSLSMVAGASGALSNIKTTVLIPIDDGVEAARKAGSIGYRPPGS